MKKTSKIFGAVALSAALALGTAVPAFAAPATPNAGAAEEVTDATQADQANTAINVSTYVSQISVALPVTLPVYANVGGGAGIAPENYYIENLSRTDIAINSIKWEIPTAAQKDWTLARNAEIADGAAPTVGSDSNEPALGSLGAVLTPKAAGSTITVGSNTYTQAGTGTAVNIQGTTANTYGGQLASPDWTLKGSTGTNISMGRGEKLLLDTNIYSSALKKQLSASYDNAIKISYTVAAQSAE